jgi:gliding motility-associated-like protein
MPDSGYYTAEVITAKTVTCGANGGSFCLPNGNIGDGQTSLDIPQGALDGNTDITITQLDPADSSIPDGKSPCAAARPAAVYRFGPEGLTFNKFVTMKQVFQDIKHAGTVDGTTDKVNTLKLFWWDGFDWRLMGGKQDPAYNLINYGNIKHFSMYALFPAKAMGDNDYRPKERIITPATVDGYNDYATFTGLDNGDIVNIYDIRGRKIRQLNDGVNTWDGKDDGNQLVESGIYIYQIKLKATGKLISGTVVIAK